MTDDTQAQSGNRRAALKALAAATGAATIAALPKQWGKPRVTVGAIPAHAQVSCGVGLRVEVTNIIGPGIPDYFFDLQQPDYSDSINNLYIWSPALCGCVAIFIGNRSNVSSTVEWTITFGNETPLVQTFGLFTSASYVFNLATGEMGGPFTTISATNNGLDSIGCPNITF